MRKPILPSRGGHRGFGYLFAVLILLLSLFLVVSSWRDARQRELDLAQAKFQASVGRVAAQVQQRLSGVELALRGGGALFAAVQWPSPRHWRDYAQSLSLQSRFPSTTGLGFAAHVDPAGLANLQLLMRDAGIGMLEVTPKGRRAVYGPIVFLEPRSIENMRAIGYDMYSEPVRRAAMRAAMESGQSRLSGPVALVQDMGRSDKGMLLYSPVYVGTVVPPTASQRRVAMKGWVYAPIRVPVMIGIATKGNRGSERMRVVDVTDPVQMVLYEDEGISADNTFTYNVTLALYGRKWRFDFFSGPKKTAVPHLVSLEWLLLAGVVVSLLLFGMMWMLASTESRAVRLAESMTGSYRRSEQRFRNAMQYSAIGKALLDSSGNIVQSNPAFSKIVGRPASELVGAALGGLLDGTDPLKTAQMESIVDITGEVTRATRTLRRENGELRQVQLTFAPVPGDPGSDVARLVQVEDVTERVRAEEAVRSLNRTLEARVGARTRELSDANRELESFAFSVSHDLRAPLRAIDGFSRILGERYDDVLDATGRDYLGRVRKATARMSELIDALLKLSRISRSGLDIRDLDFSEMAEEVGAALAEMNQQRRVDFRVQPGLRVRGDYALLRSLLDNLLGNAWKFTGDTPDARVEFGAETGAGGEVVYYVRDNGAGFDPDYQDKLFRPFQRLHSQEAFDGHGVGLASVKRIVERHGGEIEAEGATGKGAVFRFTLNPALDAGSTTA